MESAVSSTLEGSRTANLMFHCHILRHEDNGMMGQFLVVEPGTEDSVSRRVDPYGAHTR